MKTAQDNLWLFRSVQAVIINSILTMNTMAFSNFLYLVPFAMVDVGQSTKEAGVVVSVAGFTLLATQFIYPHILIYFKMRHQVGVTSSSVIIATSIVGELSPSSASWGWLRILFYCVINEAFSDFGI